MQLQRSALTSKRVWKFVLCLCGVLLGVWARALLWQAILQLFFGAMVALAAMPIMRRLERRLPAGIAASLSMLAIGAIFLGAILLIVPFVVEQVRQLVSLLPSLYGRISEWMQQAENWLNQNNISVNTDLKASILEKGQSLITGLLPATMAKAGSMLEGLSKILLAPAFAFYFLRDRKSIGGLTLLWFPVSWRDTSVRVLREIRREMTGFLRGQLMISAVVGVLTAIGLLVIGMPAWLLLGTLMGVLELIPYVGPFLGGAVVLLFALQGGMSQALWALGVVLIVQQLEGGVLSPKLMSDATRLHPVAVLLCVMLGGMAGGVLGILVAVPLLLCVRAAMRVISLRTMDLQDMNDGLFTEKVENGERAR